MRITACHSPTYLAITAERDALGDSSTGGSAASTGGEVITDVTGETSRGTTANTANSLSEAAEVAGGARAW